MVKAGVGVPFHYVCLRHCQRSKGEAAFSLSENFISRLDAPRSAIGFVQALGFLDCLRPRFHAPGPSASPPSGIIRSFRGIPLSVARTKLAVDS